jgi:hypothetical protein
MEVLQQFVERFVLFGLDIRHLDVGFRAAIAVPTVVVEHIAPEARVRGLLIVLADGGVDLQACAVHVFGKTIRGDLSGHFGNVFGMNREHVGLALDHQCLFRRLFMLLGVYEAQARAFGAARTAVAGGHASD